MLKKPYKLIDSKNFNNYYILEDESGTYLAVEYVGFKGKKYSKEYTKGLSLLPVDYFMIKLLLEYSKVKDLGKSEVDWGLESEDRYETLDLDKVKESIGIDLQELSIDAPIDYVPDNEKPILDAVLGDGYYELYSTEQYDPNVRYYTLVRTSKLGHIIVTKFVIAWGEMIKDMQTFTLGIETVKKFIEEVQKTKLFEVINKEINKEEN